MSDAEIIEFWTHKINVEIPERYKKYCQEEQEKNSQRSREIQQRKEDSEKNGKWKIIIPPSIFRVITPTWVKEESKIPVHDFEILQRNNVILRGEKDDFGYMWSCDSGRDEYDKLRKIKKCGDGTPIEGFYKIIDIINRNNDKHLICYYNCHDMNEFVSQEIEINNYQLFNPYSSGNKSSISIGDILHVKSIELIETDYDKKRYATTWEVI